MLEFKFPLYELVNNLRLRMVWCECEKASPEKQLTAALLLKANAW